MIVYPAIDLRRGKCVRLRQGAAEAETVFADDPSAMARHWQSLRAEWLHVVNLDGALGESSGANIDALRRILREASIPVQFGGGIRSVDDVQSVLDMGVRRVVLGTVAVREPEVVKEALSRFGPQAVAVGIDARDGRVAIHGWLDTTEITAVDLALRMSEVGVRHLVYTDVARDGMLTGVNVEATAALARDSGLKVIASGGVAALDDVDSLVAHRDDGIEGVIIGMALYRGVFSLPDALEIASRGPAPC